MARRNVDETKLVSGQPATGLMCDLPARRRVQAVEASMFSVESITAEGAITIDPYKDRDLWVRVAEPRKGFAILIDGEEYEFVKALERAPRVRRNAKDRGDAAAGFGIGVAG